MIDEISQIGSNLNEKQAIAANHRDGPMLVLAGPGSGKTAVITHRAKILVDKYKVAPRNILVITFTKAAAESMKERFCNLYEHEKGGEIVFSTFHSFFFKIIREVKGYTLNDVILSETVRRAVLRFMRELGIFEDDADLVQTILNEISFVKNEMINLENYNSMAISSDSFRELYRAYENWKHVNSKIDFDDMLSLCYKVLSENPKALARYQQRYKYIMVDEFQDINKVQFECVRLLASMKNNVFVVGDDDQSIYSFRGARPEFMLNFPKLFGNTRIVNLEINYRSSDEIINLSEKIISQNTMRYKKSTKGLNRAVKRPIFAELQSPSSEADWVAKTIAELAKTENINEIAVMFRTNRQALPLIDSLFSSRIPFKLKDETPNIYEHWIAKDIFAYMKLAIVRDDDSAIIRIINKPARYIKNDEISKAEKINGGVLFSLRNTNLIDKWKLGKIEELMYNLNVLKNKKPYDAFEFIYKGIKYSDHLTSYAEYRKLDPKAFRELFVEIQETAKAFVTLEDYLGHVEQASGIIKQANLDRVSQNKRANSQVETGVTLTTIHNAKGLEFDNVFIIGAVEGMIPYEKSKTPAEIEEERRLFYVAITRPRNALYISRYMSRGGVETELTSFLTDFIK